jgi:hypothetical protein
VNSWRFESLKRCEVSVIRFSCYALVAIVALVGPQWMGLVGEASASFRATAFDSQNLTTKLNETSTSGAAAQSPATPSEPVPTVIELRLGFNMPAHNGASSTASSTQSLSSSGSLAVKPEESIRTFPFVTLLRVTEERVATISSPSSVFEPPRAV